MINYYKLEEARIEKGLSVMKLCRDANVSRSAYNRYLRGEREANVELLLRLCNVLGITLNDLV